MYIKSSQFVLLREVPIELFDNINHFKEQTYPKIVILLISSKYANYCTTVQFEKQAASI
jgi:hypothetical protein